jgi:hypothetical protein
LLVEFDELKSKEELWVVMRGAFIKTLLDVMVSKSPLILRAIMFETVVLFRNASLVPKLMIVSAPLVFISSCP